MSDQAVAGMDFVQVSWDRQFEFEPFTNLHAWFFYVRERAMRLGQDVQRLVYMAKTWFRVMGVDAEPGKWKRVDVQRFVDQRLSEGVKATTVGHELTMQRAVLSHNVKYERLEKIPHFEKPPGEAQKRRPLTDEEFRLVMKQRMSARLRRFYRLAFYTGHRAAAIEGLEWNRVDFTKYTINFNEPGRMVTNKRRCAAFPIPDEFVETLRGWLAMAKDPYVIGAGSSTYHEAAHVVRDLAGIKDKSLVPRHCMRKMFATTLFEREVNPEVVGRLLADDPNTLRKHYVSFKDATLRSAVNRRAAR